MKKKWNTAFLLVIFAVVIFVLVSGHIKASVKDGKVWIEGSYWPDYQVKLQDIKSVSYSEDFEPGRRVGGFGSWRLLQGSFRNKEFGNYTLYAYAGRDSYVILETETGWIVINVGSKEKTKELYEEILQAVSQ